MDFSWTGDEEGVLNPIHRLRIPVVEFIAICQHKKNPQVGIRQPGESKIKVHLPIKCSSSMPANPDKVIKAEKVK
ncbi:hypothetical protein [Nostoc sp. 106C]|uniref:hypothetical protein n=1 Tax=Nostoc sp. 106C TaxID=1932667 RepID=UPI000A36E347|nr:hypothetical protein [Nostoc sp. 106C]OUL26910.1 hypothetical protein BV375_20215 [Nostoc sp. 106C]